MAFIAPLSVGAPGRDPDENNRVIIFVRYGE